MELENKNVLYQDRGSSMGKGGGKASEEREYNSCGPFGTGS
jgi:hypothetical protein